MIWVGEEEREHSHEENNPGQMLRRDIESTPQTALFGVKAPLRALIRAGNGSK
jgi:hypothetical protein